MKTLFIYSFSVFLFITGCREKCPKPKNSDEFNLIKWLEVYPVNQGKNISGHYFINSYQEVDDILVKTFKYGGNISFIDNEETIIGIGVFVNHYGYNISTFDIPNLLIKEYINSNLIEFEVTAKEEYEIANENRFYRWIWFKIPKIMAGKTIKITRKYEPKI